jgi:hypothetical protein
MTDRLALLHAFETDQIDPAAFTHRLHVEVAAAMLAEADFLDAARRYQTGIARIAARGGAETKANLTITLAFLSLIAERLHATPDGADLIETHPNLMDRELLTRWYSRERLADPHARRTFLMPDRAA